MLEYKSSSGHVFYLNNLINAVIVLIYLIWVCRVINSPKRDKGLHSIASAGLTAIHLWLFEQLHFAWWVAPILVLLYGIGKEILDLINPKKKLFDYKDIVADISGIVIVVLVYILTNFL